MKNLSKKQTQVHITAQKKFFKLNLKELLAYRDLISLFIKRDFISQYKQTILGPIWFLLQPLLTTLIFVIVFGNIAQMSTSGLPKLIFYLSGTIIWTYFSNNITLVSDTFISNKRLFSKVYFPRLTVPISFSISNLLKFGLQFLLFIGFVIYYVANGMQVTLGPTLLMLPVIFMAMIFLSTGIGLLFASMTAKYRDLRFVLQFTVQLLMYGTPVIYPMSIIPEKWYLLIWLNPVSGIVESFRNVFFFENFDYYHMGYSLVVSLLLLILGLLVFNYRQQTVADVI